MRIVKGISFDEELLERIDAARGQTPRSTFVTGILKKALGKSRAEKGGGEQ